MPRPLRSITYRLQHLEKKKISRPTAHWYSLRRAGKDTKARRGDFPIQNPGFAFLLAPTFLVGGAFVPKASLRDVSIFEENFTQRRKEKTRISAHHPFILETNKENRKFE